MTGRLAGKTALVTGAGRGIGQAIARAYQREGARVLATSRSLAPLRDLAHLPGVTIHELDITDRAAVEALAASLTRLEVLVNAAGYVAQGALGECTPEDFDLCVDINLRGTYTVLRAFLPALIAADGAAVVNIASVVSSLAAASDRFVYAATKAAMIAMTKSVALDYLDRGLRCNAICPGAIETPSMAARIAGGPDPEATRARIVARHKMGRMGRVEEVAELAVHLAAEESGFMTGQALVVDGAMTL